MWNTRAARGVANPKASTAKVAEAPPNIPRTWLPNAQAVVLFGKSVLKNVEEYYSLPSALRATYLKQHANVRNYLDLIKRGPQTGLFTAKTPGTEAPRLRWNHKE